MSVVEVSVDYGGRKLTLQTGKLAKQADASVLATYGETMVLVTVVSSRKLGANPEFFPLTVDFQEKYYSAGRLPGGFFKREAKPSDRATLSARLIDRPCRPLFPEDYLYETNVVATVLSTDGENESDFLASIAASTALHISDIPFNGPVGSCRVGFLDGKFVTNPPPAEQANSTVDLLVSGVRTGIVMVEGSAKEVSEQVMMDALDFAHREMGPIFDLQDELRKKVGKEKRTYSAPPQDEKLKAEVRKFSWAGFEKAFAIREKLARYEALAKLGEEVGKKFAVAEPVTDADKTRNKLVKTYFEEVKAAYAREKTLNTKARIDGRPYNEIRPIASDVGLLPRVHGSAVFTRGETQVLATVTLGTSDDEQKIDSINGVYQKTFMLHYNFPPYSVGEARPLRPPGRREIGHGFLAERALQYIIPPREKFPYTLRIVSEVLESNGSSSMATVCSGSLALMDAGVPIPKAVAGVAMGLIKEGNQIAVLSDILGDEDHLGDMDFKVCGTRDGVTAFQMDLKIGGVSRDIMEQALAQAREGRLHILDKMDETLKEARPNFSRYAPRIFQMKVKPEKVREVIGSGGKVIRGIIERTGVKIDIEDDGTINIASADETSAQKAIEIINQIIEEPEPGKTYEGRITKIADFGAFVEIIPGTEGLCHISELEHFRVRRVDDVVQVGEMMKVKCLEVDPSGKIRLSRRALLPKDGGGGPAPDEGEGGGREPRGSREGRDAARDAARDSDRPERPSRGRSEGGGRSEAGGRTSRRDRFETPDEGGSDEEGSERGRPAKFDREEPADDEAAPEGGSEGRSEARSSRWGGSEGRSEVTDLSEMPESEDRMRPPERFGRSSGGRTGGRGPGGRSGGGRFGSRGPSRGPSDRGPRHGGGERHSGGRGGERHSSGRGGYGGDRGGSRHGGGGGHRSEGGRSHGHHTRGPRRDDRPMDDDIGNRMPSGNRGPRPDRFGGDRPRNDRPTRDRDSGFVGHHEDEDKGFRIYRRDDEDY